MKPESNAKAYADSMIYNTYEELKLDTCWKWAGIFYRFIIPMRNWNSKGEIGLESRQTHEWVSQLNYWKIKF